MLKASKDYRFINDESSLVSLIDNIDEHLGKTLALGAMLTVDNIFSMNRELVDHYFGHIRDELWEIRMAWKQLTERIIIN